MGRVEEIRERLREYEQAVEWDEEAEAVTADLYYRYTTDVPYLLDRVAELDEIQRNQRDRLWVAAGEVDELQNRVSELERENAELKRQAGVCGSEYQGGLPDKPPAVCQLSNGHKGWHYHEDETHVSRWR